MHHFLIEFITGGGMTGLPLSESLRNEGNLMLQTLIDDLSAMGCEKLSVTRDARCQLDSSVFKQQVVTKSLHDELPKMLKDMDVIWLIAPETDDAMTSLTELALKSPAMVICSSPESIRLTSSKYKTFEILNETDIEIVETGLLGDSIPESKTGWVIKPDDGVGGEKCQRIKNIEHLDKEKSEKNNFIIQPYLKGEHLSMSLLVYRSDFRLLACNKQYINWEDGQARLTGIGVNECLELQENFQQLAQKIINEIPGLAGYIGIDLIKTDDAIQVVEINPRLTTAFTGISESLGVNITEAILNTFLTHKLPDIDLSNARPVKINV